MVDLGESTDGNETSQPTQMWVRPERVTEAGRHGFVIGLVLGIVTGIVFFGFLMRITQ